MWLRLSFACFSFFFISVLTDFISVCFPAFPQVFLTCAAACGSLWTMAAEMRSREMFSRPVLQKCTEIRCEKNASLRVKVHVCAAANRTWKTARCPHVLRQLPGACARELRSESRLNTEVGSSGFTTGLAVKSEFRRSFLRILT